MIAFSLHVESASFDFKFLEIGLVAIAYKGVLLVNLLLNGLNSAASIHVNNFSRAFVRLLLFEADEVVLG